MHGPEIDLGKFMKFSKRIKEKFESIITNENEISNVKHKTCFYIGAKRDHIDPSNKRTAKSGLKYNSVARQDSFRYGITRKCVR
jgi:hypothetical protein